MNWRLFILVCALVAVAAHGQPAANAPLPKPPLPLSPVTTFRLLLATNDAGRAQMLATRSPEQRRFVESKIAEFLSLAPDERERRLQVLQLRWYLPQLMRLPLAEQTARLSQIPELDRKLIKSKLDLFRIMPPAMQKDLLDNQQAISMVASAGQQLTSSASLPPQLEDRVRQLNNLPAEKRDQLYANYDRFFGLSGAEQNKALARLTPAERTQMEHTLTTFTNLPPSQRVQALAGFKKFAELSPIDRAAFLKTAERWQAMTEPERENWRRMVDRLRKAGALPVPPAPGKGKVATALIGSTN